MTAAVLIIEQAPIGVYRTPTAWQGVPSGIEASLQNKDWPPYCWQGQDHPEHIKKHNTGIFQSAFGAKILFLSCD